MTICSRGYPNSILPYPPNSTSEDDPRYSTKMNHRPQGSESPGIVLGNGILEEPNTWEWQGRNEEVQKCKDLKTEGEVMIPLQHILFQTV